MSSGEHRPTPLRRDARRNRDMLLAAARTVYAEQGVDAPLDDIARRAGVGNATLYRHFAGRAALVEAVFSDALTAVLDAGEQARRNADAWAGLTGYLEHVFELLAADRGAGDLMTAAVEGVPSLEALRPHNHETIDTLLCRAREQGAVRDDITTEDLLFLLAALGRAVPAAAAAAPGAWRRCLALFLDGLRAGAGRPLPAPPLTPEQFGTAVRHLGCRPPRDG
ncbi:TetR/AcrR family transcriptional regulator [Streptomyces sp. AV19]|uniref:TetR/AcrR family transcriptional regulator n=1 Tax=Streptomyces sp. AV19 TaxID=2793068 RepID=UPI0018FEFC40|nr:TetR/AcrR family transcriptional regulator [Streptomyces sp. AV19]MBH1937582.1 TetR/AcrR family transcriptional regulator [Streptomyces sp. AV19]MDG4533597.1 TetR/AcrR family transcriptional regulator [Streptomyces sp. AV19]